MTQQYYNEVRKQRSCEKLGITSGQWSYIKRLGTMLENCYVNDCNGFYNEYTGKEDERRAKWNENQEARLEKNAQKFANDNKLYLYLQTDPRGATIYLDKVEIPENNYTQAVCIY
jgi:hypothetical protein